MALNRKGDYQAPNPLKLKATGPKDGEIVSATGIKAIKFGIKSAKKVANSILQVSISPNFDSISKSKKIKVSTPGKYFWRVRGISKSGQALSSYSNSSPVEISRLIRAPSSLPRIRGTFPINGRTIIFVGKGRLELMFKWITPNKNGFFKFEISQTPIFDSPILKLKTKDSKIYVSEDLPEGPLYWRIGRDRNGLDWSETYIFNLKKEVESYLINDEDKPIQIKVDSKKLIQL